MKIEDRIRTRRVYDARHDSDGLRVLVDRLWPRGIRKQDPEPLLWLKDLAPSTELRKWFAHDPSRFTDFRSRYLIELEDKRELAKSLLNKSGNGPVTLLYAARDRSCNHAMVLQEYLNGLAQEL